MDDPSPFSRSAAFIAVLSVVLSVSARAADSRDAQLAFARYANYVWLPVRVNGSQPLEFVLDSGASASVIGRRAADALALEVTGSRAEEQLGTGQGSGIVGHVRNVRLEMSGIEIRKKDLAVFSIDSLEQAVGHRIDGILGSEIFKRYVVEIDYSTSRVTLSDPATYRYRGRGQVLPLDLRDNRPFVHALIVMGDTVPVAGRFVIDTGANGTLNLHTPFVQKHGFLSSSQRTLEHFIHGTAGVAPELLARAHSLRIGDFVITDPDVALSTATRGSTADASYDGAIGAEVLRRFKVIFDYAHKHVILERTAAYDEPFAVDMSGASLVAAGPDLKVFTVEHVLPDSPMFTGGVREGDVIAAIDGISASGYRLDELRRMFEKEGQEIALTVVRNGESLQTKIALRKLL